MQQEIRNRIKDEIETGSIPSIIVVTCRRINNCAENLISSRRYIRYIVRFVFLFPPNDRLAPHSLSYYFNPPPTHIHIHILTALRTVEEKRHFLHVNISSSRKYKTQALTISIFNLKSRKSFLYSSINFFRIYFSLTSNDDNTSQGSRERIS